MEIRNIKKNRYFNSVDGSEITEVFGIPTKNLKEVSLAYAIVKPNSATLNHLHSFLEIYTIIKGNGVMHVNEEAHFVKKNDSILIPAKSSHFIKNSGKKNMEFYCICVPAFTEDGTELKKEA